VTHNEKIDLLKHAAMFVFPSLYEGFGIPVLESMAVGTPVITSNVSSLPEITDDSAITVDPGDEQKLSQSMELLLKNPKKCRTLSVRGIAQAKKFSWSAAARETIAVYHKIGKK
jgi:glycosyltransferase involved in cell wall biosynthesis